MEYVLVPVIIPIRHTSLAAVALQSVHPTAELVVAMAVAARVLTHV